MDNGKILQKLMSMQDEEYRKFHTKLVPGIENIIGIRAPEIKKLAKEIARADDIESYLDNAGHNYYEEILLNGQVLGAMKIDCDTLKKRLDVFIPRIDNWAICDMTVGSLKLIEKNLPVFYSYLKEKTLSDNPWTIRFGVVSLMSYYIKDEYIDELLELFASIRSEHYYVNMSLAWALSVAMIKFYEKTVKYIESRCLSPWIHNKTIQKSIESFRITPERKEYLKSIKVKNTAGELKADL